MAEQQAMPARLLVVDDSKVNRLLLTRGLEQHGHQVASAENGRIALEMLREQEFDLLLLDIEMPEMNGFQVLEHLTADPRLRDLPVVVTSSLEGMDDVVRCIELGAEDYLHKPVNAVLLKARGGASLVKKRLRGAQVLLIDHDVDLIAATCQQTLVMDFGRRLALGPTAQVLTDADVRRAYLGG